MTVCSRAFIYPLCFFVLILMLIACSAGSHTEKTDPAYVKEIDEWHASRIESLTSESGWLTLAGLFWLKEGENSFGSSLSNNIVFPDDRAPDVMGAFILDNGQVHATIQPGIDVLHEGAPVTETVLKSDGEGDPTILTFGSLSFYVIQRDSRYAIRLKDSENPKRKNFKGIERFPVSAGWRIEAEYVKHDPPKKIPIPTVLGTIADEPSPGFLKFKINDTTYELDVLGDADDDDLFIVFGDRTNGTETYGGGRFLSVKKPDESGTTFIDFNKAYNPPCVFTEYATCPRPPVQNVLPVKVTAGEKIQGYEH